MLWWLKAWRNRLRLSFRDNHLMSDCGCEKGQKGQLGGSLEAEGSPQNGVSPEKLREKAKSMIYVESCASLGVD